MTDQPRIQSFYREPQPDELPILVTDVALVHLISGSNLPANRFSYHTDKVLDPTVVPQKLAPEQMAILSDQINELAQTGQSKYKPNSKEARRLGRNQANKVVSWLGELAAHHADFTTAESAVQELKFQGGLRNRRQAHKLTKLVKNLRELDRIIPNRSLDDETAALEA